MPRKQEIHNGPPFKLFFFGSDVVQRNQWLHTFTMWDGKREFKKNMIIIFIGNPYGPKTDDDLYGFIGFRQGDREEKWEHLYYVGQYNVTSRTGVCTEMERREFFSCPVALSLFVKTKEEIASSIFFSVEVDPITDIDIACRRGGMTCPEDVKRHLHFPSPKNKDERKRVFIVPCPKSFSANDFLAHIAEYGLCPCGHAPEYLLGLMAHISEGSMPSHLYNVSIVAAWQLWFPKTTGVAHFFSVVRRGVRRRLSFVSSRTVWNPEYAFLAEKAPTLSNQSAPG